MGVVAGNSRVVFADKPKFGDTVKLVSDGSNYFMSQVAKVIKKTKVTYSDGSVVEYDIQGELTSDSAPFRDEDGSTNINAVTVEIGDAVTSIGNYTFDGCWQKLTSVIIPDSVTSIGEFAFNECTSLTSITIPNSVTSIGTYAFYQCESLTSIIIPDSVTSIGSGAFRYCTGLTSITLSGSITKIPNLLIMGDTILTSIIYNGTMEQWNALTKGNVWHEGVPSTTVVTCTDGTVALD